MTSRFSADKALTEAITIRSTGLLRLALTVTNGGKPRRPHQAFITISSADSGLEESFPLTINDAGKAKLDIVRDHSCDMTEPN
jgi:oligosaccharyltransferase complex subunit delta (ribophorin II)